MTTTWDVIVVGGGLAGLAAGATAARTGASTLVLEAHRPGGRARTSEKDGYVFNLGAHALYAGSAGMPVLRELGVTLAGSKPPLKEYHMLIDGELHLMPSGPGTLLKTTALSARSKAAFAKVLGLLSRVKPAEHAHKTVDEWLAEQGLRPDAERVIRALIRTGTYTDQFDQLSAGAALAQMQSGASKGVLYLDGGWGPMVEQLRAQVEVREGASVSTVSGGGGSVVVELADGSRVVGRSAVVAPGYVVSTDDPVFATRQSPPARQAPEGDSVLAILRYGTTNATDDRASLDRYRRLAGVDDSAVAVERFLARMVVTGAMPLARNGGLAGRPAVDATGSPRVFLAGDWVGADGMLADASLASGHAAALAAVRAGERSATMVA